MFDEGLFGDDDRGGFLECVSRLKHSYPIDPVDAGSRLEPLEMLILAYLSQRTTHANASLGFERLWKEYPRWRGVVDAPTSRVQSAISMTTWPEQKAPRVQAALRNVEYWRGGRLDLDNLYAMSNADAGAWLERLPGVRRKTSNSVLLFSTLQRPVLPVDTGHRRVLTRLGFLSRAVGWDDAHAVVRNRLLPDWDAVEIELYHDVVKRHSRTVCTANDPACGRCALLDLCRYGQWRMGGGVERRTKPVRIRRPLTSGQLCLPY